MILRTPMSFWLLGKSIYNPKYMPLKKCADCKIVYKLSRT
jgi:hypothetical protein